MLTHLSIHHLRNLQAVHIDVGQCNVIVGANGSGKTSLLESLYLLSRGKSFRHHQPKRYISHHAPHVTVHAKFANGSSMAVQKSQDATSLMRLDQQPVYVQSTLTKRLPTLLIDPSSMDILEIGSGSRRQLLDWITFHVKPGFHAQWLSYQRLLKQRNTLLKQAPRLSSYQLQELAAWDKGLANHAALITHYRQQAFEEWQPLFNELIQQLLPDYAPFIQLRFSAGYNTELGLDELLQQRLAQDCQTGYTRIGCHRADVQVLWIEDEEARQQASQQQSPVSQTIIENPTQQQHEQKFEQEVKQDNSIDLGYEEALDSEGIQAEDNSYLLPLSKVREQAANVLSRGEKKLLITALKLSQLPLLPGTKPGSDDFMQQSESLPIILLDDITAELDDRALNILLKSLSQLSCQVFITSLDPEIMDKIQQYWSKPQMFHMKQGNLISIPEA